MTAKFPERLSRRDLHALQGERLRDLLRETVPANPFWRSRFRSAGVQADHIRSLDDLTVLPLTTKADLAADHAAHPPYGSNLTYDLTAYSR
ncbi:MAG: phenylacetate--CoA ligase family protein, partial [Planctomycetaceae bacterium]